MNKLTKIEMLDGQYPGLADEVGKWFAQGVTCKQIAARLTEKYKVKVTTTTVGGYRFRRWVPERDRLREKRLEALAAQEVASEREVKAALAVAARGETR